MKAKIYKDGRIVIPKPMRKRLGIELEQDVTLEVEDNKIIITNREKEESLEEYRYKIKKALEELEEPFNDNTKFDSWYKVAEIYKEQIKNAKKTLLGE